MGEEVARLLEPAGVERLHRLQELTGVRRHHHRMAVQHEILGGLAGRQVLAGDIEDLDGHAADVLLAVGLRPGVGEAYPRGVGAGLCEEADAMLRRQGIEDRELGLDAAGSASLVESLDRSCRMPLGARLLDELDEAGDDRGLVR